MALSGNTKVSLTIATVITLAGSVWVAAWQVRGYMADFQATQVEANRQQVETNRQLFAIQQEISSLKPEFVTQQQIRLFADNMRYENKEMKLFVPDPKQYATR